MANKIKPKRSYTTNSVPTTADLEVNELAINWADGIAYTKNAAGQIVSFTLGGGGGGGGFSWSAAPVAADDTAAAGSLAYDAEYLYVATGANTWKRTALESWKVGPDAPTNLVATAGDGQVSLAWTAPSVTRGELTDYEVQYSDDGGTTWTTHVEPPPAAASISQIDDGGYTWTGSGTLANPFVTSYLRSGTPSVRGGSPGNWTSSNRPAWQVTGSGTFNYTITNMVSADSDADHTLYKSTDSGSTWSLAHMFTFGPGSQTASFAVADGDIVEQRGNGSSYSSDTWVDNPTVWLE